MRVYEKQFCTFFISEKYKIIKIFIKVFKGLSLKWMERNLIKSIQVEISISVLISQILKGKGFSFFSSFYKSIS